MQRYYLVFVPDLFELKDQDDYSEVVDWAIMNLDSRNVLRLSEDDIYNFEYNTIVLDIINEENSGMLQMGEDDWIISDEIKQRILLQLQNYVKSLPENDIKRLTLEIIRLFTVAVERKANIYFLF